MDPNESTTCEDVIEPGQHIDGYERFAIYPVKGEVVRGGLSEEHGQLLACLHPKVQMQALEGLKKLDDTPSPDHLRGMIESLAVVLETQGFDKSDCSSCRFNSNNHGLLFSQVIAPGLCVNKVCADQRPKAQPRKAPKTPPKAPTSELDSYRVQLWRHALTGHLLHLPDDRRPLVALALASCCKGPEKPLKGLIDVHEGKPLSAVVNAAMGSEPVTPADAYRRVIINVIERLEVDELHGLLGAFRVELGRYWVLTEALFQKLSSEQTFQLWREMGLPWNSELQSALEQGKHLGLMKEVLSQYDLNGFIPSILKY